MIDEFDLDGDGESKRDSSSIDATLRSILVSFEEFLAMLNAD